MNSLLILLFLSITTTLPTGLDGLKLPSTPHLQHTVFSDVQQHGRHSSPLLRRPLPVDEDVNDVGLAALFDDHTSPFDGYPEGTSEDALSVDDVFGAVTSPFGDPALDTAVSAPPRVDATVVCPNCTCVPYLLCLKMWDGSSSTDSALPTSPLEDNTCPELLDVLCLVPKEDEESSPEETVSDANEEQGPTCGRRNHKGVGTTLNGYENPESQFGEFPWMAIILQEEPMTSFMAVKRFICGGSLIHHQVVMTAAHCVHGKNASTLTIRLGEWDTQSRVELFPHEDHRVADVKLHGRFHSVNLRNDVALIFLEKPVELKEHIDIICLPEENENFDNSSCVATGFGRDRFHDGSFQNVMKQVNLPLLPYQECQSKLRRTSLGPWFRLHPTFTCAGGEEGVDTCTGDGGSGLACPSKEDPTRYVQAGIVAWGIGCGEGGVPGVYTSVPKLVKWVNEKIAEHFEPTAQSPLGYGPPPV